MIMASSHYIGEGAMLTLISGTIRTTGVGVYVNGTFVMSGGTIEGTGTYGYGVNVQMNGIVQISGGNIVGTSSGFIDISGSSVSLSGGTYTGGEYSLEVAQYRGSQVSVMVASGYKIIDQAGSAVNAYTYQLSTSPVTIVCAHSQGNSSEATCTKGAICVNCGEAYGELDAANHTGGTEIKNAKDATCGDEGYTGDTHCKGCGELVTKGTSIKATGKHTYGKWKVIKEATKTATGEKQRTCSACGHIDSEKIPKLSDIPATGDDANIFLWGSALCISTMALIVLLLDNKRRKSAK